MLKALFYIIFTLIIIKVVFDQKDDKQKIQVTTQAPSQKIVETPKWYSNGNLHKANVGQWKTATYENKLATAADWSISIPQIKAKVQISDIEVLKPFAIELLTCVNEAADSKGYETIAAAELCC